MRDAKPLQLQRRGRGVALRLPVLIQLLGFLLLLLAGVARGQQSPLPPDPPAPPLAPALSAVEKQLNNLTNNVAETISDNFSFCVADP